MCLPEKTIDYLFERFVYIFKSVFSSSIQKTEQNIRETFKIKVLHSLPAKSIHIWHPHGLSGVTPVIHNGYRISDPEYKQTKGVVHYFFFWIPFIKDIIRNLNAIPSDYTSIKNTLQTESISIALGGAHEQKIFKSNIIDVIVKNRRGIFKIALETGTPIVPVLTYGENELFPRMDNSFLECYNDYLYLLFKVRFPFPSLQSIYNWQQISDHPLEPIHSYTGRPIYVKKIEFPSKKHIDKLRSIYISRVQELFEKTKKPGFTLNII
jgi:2-acylglycerol O-acyltransferase 2